MTNEQFTRRIIEMAKAHIGEMDREQGDGPSEYRAMAIGEHLAGAMVQLIKELAPQVNLQRALNACLSNVLTIFMPASKYNGIDYDKLDEFGLHWVIDQLHLMLAGTGEYPEFQANGPIGPHNFEFELLIDPEAEVEGRLAREAIEAENWAVAKGLGGASD